MLVVNWGGEAGKQGDKGPRTGVWGIQSKV